MYNYVWISFRHGGVSNRIDGASIRDGGGLYGEAVGIRDSSLCNVLPWMAV